MRSWTTPRAVATQTIGLIICLTAGVTAASAQAARAAGKSPPAQRVVFVCEHGTVKSLVALEFFNRLARERGLNAVAISRGTNPDSVVPTPVRTGLTADGFNINDFHSQRFSAGDLSQSMLVVALDANVDSVVAGKRPVVRWDGLPSVTQNYDGARTAIAAHVTHLVDSLVSIQKQRRKSH